MSMDDSGDDAYRVGLRHFMESQIPFNAFVGLRVLDLGRGYAILLLPYRPELVGDPFRPALHGGTISMLADTAGGAAVFSGAEPGDRVSTIDLRVDYLRPAALVDTRAEARLVRLGGRVGVARIQVWQEETEGNASDEARAGEAEGRRLVAEATGVYSVRRGLGVPAGARLAVEGAGGGAGGADGTARGAGALGKR